MLQMHKRISIFAALPSVIRELHGIHFLNNSSSTAEYAELWLVAICVSKQLHSRRPESSSL